MPDDNAQTTPDFEIFWAEYPRRIAKKTAQKAYEKAIREGAKSDEILLAVNRYKNWLKATDGWRPEPKYAATWLNGGCWEDEYPVAETYRSPEESRRTARLEGFHRTGYWIDQWGDRPKTN